MANGMVEMANAHMLGAMRLVLIPPSPGMVSALGMLMTDVTHAFVATRRHLLARLDPAVRG